MDQANRILRLLNDWNSLFTYPSTNSNNQPKTGML